MYHIKDSTKKGYISTLKRYTEFHNMSIDELLKEAYLDEENHVLLKNRRIKKRLIDYRNELLSKNMSSKTIKTYFSKLITFYRHYEVEIPVLPNVKFNKNYEINYFDLPTKEHIRKSLDLVSIDFKALILFMSSSGTAKAETLSLTVDDFIKGVSEYYKSNNLKDILDELSNRNDIIPTVYLKRIKTDKYYYTFCSSEASNYIIKYLKTKKNLQLNDKLFPISNSLVITRFQQINDQMKWGFKGNYRFFRTHTLRKFHASNIGLSSEYVDALQGRSKNSVHETYIKTNPQNLKEKYKKVMKNILILENEEKKEIKEEINITINIFLADNQYNIQ
ncbi:integrase [Methanobrevibacter sp. 87.7]|uniref:integrase n=1 Tax=Methanobrevibacter sp. 87.7 TaxID=387957 RepID=UPI001E4EF694|nr:integrase [Methanobrevibacter sp. 87.7]